VNEPLDTKAIIDILGLTPHPQGGHYAETRRADTAPGDGRIAATIHVLGSDLRAGERPQGIVPVGDRQAARSTGDWTLIGCTVSPGFRFEGWEVAAPGWEPGQDRGRLAS